MKDNKTGNRNSSKETPELYKYLLIGLVIFSCALFISVLTRMILMLDGRIMVFTDTQAGVVTSTIEGAVSSIAAGLLLYQLKVDSKIEQHQNEIQEAEFYHLFVNYWLEADKLFIQYPHLRKYFYDNASVNNVDSNEEELIYSISEYFDDLFTYSEDEIMHTQRHLISDKHVKSYQKYMEYIKKSPAFTAYKNRYISVINTQGSFDT